MTNACDLIVIGAGPAGLASATLAAELGLSVVAIDEQATPGGQIYRNIEAADRAEFEAILGKEYFAGAELTEKFRAAGVDYRPGVAVWRVDPDGSMAWSDGEKAGVTRGRRIIAATGAMERPVPIPGWTLPGVMGAGGAQTLLKSAGMAPRGRVVIAGSGPLMMLVAQQLHAAEAEIVAVVDTTRFGAWFKAAPHVPRAFRASDQLAKGSAMIKRVRAIGTQIHWWAHSIEAKGRGKLESVAFTASGAPREIEADMLLLHEGVVPNTQLTRQIGCDHEWYPVQRYWRPVVDDWGATSIDILAVAGDGGGIFGAEAAAIHGRLAALDAAFRLGAIDQAMRDDRAKTLRQDYDRATALRPMLDRLYAPEPKAVAPADDATLVCRCEEITAGDIREAVRLGATGPNQLKAFTRCGMGPCQGRMCGLTVSEVIAAECGRSVEEVGAFRIRPPLKPVTLAELAAMED